MNLEFLNPEYFIFLVIIPIIIVWNYFNSDKLTNSIKFSNSEAFGESGNFYSKLKSILKYLRLISIILIVTSLARPQVIDTSTRVKTNSGIDIIMAIDVSASMLAKDLKPNRLDALKNVAEEFIKNRISDRIGLVEYAGESYTKTPLTTDKSVTLRSLKDIKYNNIIEGGTAIGMGLATSVNRIKDSKAKSKVIILLTDGVNNAGFIDPMTAAELATEFQIKIYSIGLGTNGLALSPVGIDSRGKFNYANVQVEIDEKLLTQISEMTGGKYFRATDNDRLKEIYSDIDELEKTEIEEFKYYSVDEKYRYFLLPAIILIAFEMIMKLTILRSFI
ncbi:MAG: VWA domain-containing protein [Flavobacteriaceae bacterium]|nr:VWA domain-containing protein [Flavobacteriaceae bacterium]|tara:strand:- start:219 stop:1217 length:999 start_codon:yes stop_codon:yes gene_type:complete